MMYTSKDAGHRHKWMRNKKYTTFNAGHRHRIKGKIAMKADGHTHKLLMMKKIN